MSPKNLDLGTTTPIDDDSVLPQAVHRHLAPHPHLDRPARDGAQLDPYRHPHVHLQRHLPPRQRRRQGLLHRRRQADRRPSQVSDEPRLVPRRVVELRPTPVAQRHAVVDRRYIAAVAVVDADPLVAPIVGHDGDGQNRGDCEVGEDEGGYRYAIDGVARDAGADGEEEDAGRGCEEEDDRAEAEQTEEATPPPPVASGARNTDRVGCWLRRRGLADEEAGSGGRS